jgi:A118 family predicted phage portal protein
MNKTLEKDLTKLFIDRGFNPVMGTIYEQQQIWLSWYRGNVDGFHEITKKNAEGRNIEIHKPSLQMAKKVSEDITSLLFNEKVKLLIDDNAAQKVLDDKLDANNFYDEMTNFVELTCPYGTGVRVEYISNNEIKMNYLFGDKVVIIDYENTTPTAIAVIQQFSKDGKKYNHVMYHTFSDGIYRIQHEMYSSKDANGLGKPDALSVLFTDVELAKMKHTREDDNVTIVEYYTDYETNTPHFQTFKLAITNNYDVQSPLGISVFANSIGTLENIDEKYYSSRMDSINSRKRIFIDEEATKISKSKNADGSVEYRKYFDPEETQYQVLKDMASDSNKAVEAFAPLYDSAQHDTAIQMELNYLSSKTMLGSNYYSFENGAVGYQNEMNVIASNSDTFRNRQKNINRLKIVLVNMMKSIMYLAKENGEYNGNLELDYDVQFDDDIMTDDATVIEQYRKDAEAGIIPYEMYLIKAYAMNEDDAQEIAKKATVYKDLENGIISIKEAQRIKHPEMSDEELEINYIQTLVEKGIPLTPEQANKYNGVGNAE